MFFLLASSYCLEIGRGILKPSPPNLLNPIIPSDGREALEGGREGLEVDRDGLAVSKEGLGEVGTRRREDDTAEGRTDTEGLTSLGDVPGWFSLELVLSVSLT